MGRRGPHPTPIRELRRQARQIYEALRDIDIGTVRFDHQRYKEFRTSLDKIEYSPEIHARYDEREANIRAATFRSEKERERRLKHLFLETISPFEIERIERRWHTLFRRFNGRPEVIDELLQSSTPEAVRKITEKAFPRTQVQVFDPVQDRLIEETVELRYWLAKVIDEHATAIADAKKHRRFPESHYASNRLKQLWFLSRVLAGAMYGLRPRTAIDLIPALSHKAKRSRKEER